MVNIMSSDIKDKDIGVAPFGRKTKLSRRSFTRYVKAILFETSLVKKLRNKKLGQKLYRTCTNDKYSKPKSKSRDNIPVMNGYTCGEDNNHSTRISTIFPHCSCTTSSTTNSSSSTTTAATTSRCSSSSISWDSRPETLEYYVPRKVGNGNQKGCNGSDYTICLLLVSLLVLVIWGKVCAIFCTTTWLFFAWRGSSTVKHVPSEKTAVDDHHFQTDTELCKKKVIMEGLLERDRSRNRFPF
ncbi:hypothetical protein PTKIN_Ptkin14bG0095700 [Pterospermum kingtungense]